MSATPMATSKKTSKAKTEGSGKAASTAGKAEKGGKTEVKGDAASKRRLGLRGAAPWAARHAAKHAAEARARAAEPPLPGSARATIRTPAKAEDIKAKIGDLHNALSQIKGMRKNFHKSFFDVGGILRDVQARKLYEAKGFGSFEAFLEREVDFGKTTGLRLVRIAAIFQKEAAIEYGLERLTAALLALEAGPDGIVPPAPPSGKIPPAPVSSPLLPLKPPGRA